MYVYYENNMKQQPKGIVYQSNGVHCDVSVILLFYVSYFNTFDPLSQGEVKELM